MNWFAVLAHHADPHARQGDHGVRGRDDHLRGDGRRGPSRWPAAWPNAASAGATWWRILSYNCPEFLETVFAANYLGAIAMPINWRLAAPEVRYILEHSGARALVCDEALVDLADEATRGMEAALVRACVSPTTATDGRRSPICAATLEPAGPRRRRRPTTSTA